MATPRNSKASEALVDDPSSPYFLHHSDSPGLSLVSQQLTGDNYSSWSRSVRIALSVKNKLGFVDGAISKPAAEDTGLLGAWTWNNNIVISWLLNSVSKEISASILYATTAKEIWTDLKERFEQSNGPRIFQIKKEIISLSQGQDSVAVYYTKLKGMWEELSNFRPVCSCSKCDCGGLTKLHDHHQLEYIMTFLMGLNDSFAHARGQILLMDPMPPINKVFVFISQEERQRAVSTPSVPSPLAFVARHEENRKPPSQFTQGNSSVKPNNNSRRTKLHCSHCNLPGHTIEKCYKLHGYPPGYRQRQQSGSSGNRVNQVHAQESNISQSTTQDSSNNFFSTLSSDQYQHLMTMLSTHLSTNSGSADTVAPTGDGNQQDDWQG